MYDKIKEYGLYIVLGILAMGALISTYFVVKHTKTGYEIQGNNTNAIIDGTLQGDSNIKAGSTMGEKILLLNGGKKLGNYFITEDKLNYVISEDYDKIIEDNKIVDILSDLDVTDNEIRTILITGTPTKVDGNDVNAIELYNNGSIKIGEELILKNNLTSISNVFKGYSISGIGYGPFDKSEAKEFKDNYFGNYDVFEIGNTGKYVVLGEYDTGNFSGGMLDSSILADDYSCDDFIEVQEGLLIRLNTIQLKLNNQYIQANEEIKNNFTNELNNIKSQINALTCGMDGLTDLVNTLYNDLNDEEDRINLKILQLTPCTDSQEKNEQQICETALYLDTNLVTVKAKDFAIQGKEYVLNDTTYYVAGSISNIQDKIFNDGYPANRIVTTKLTSMQSLFSGRTDFNQNISNWDTSNVTSMKLMFYQASSFNQPLTYWNTSNVANMYGMFYQASSFNQNLGNWDVSHVINMLGMFREDTAFNNGGVDTIRNWNTSSVTTMNQMFRDASSFNQNIGTWNVSNLNSAEAMFRSALAFNNGGSDSIKNWRFATDKDVAVAGMFYQAIAFNQPLNDWNTGRFTDANGMFSYTYIFNQPLDNWDTSHMTNMTGMFRNNPVFDQNLRGWDVSNVEYYSNFDKSTSATWKFNEKPRFVPCESYEEETEVACETAILLDSNGITMKATNKAIPGKEYVLNDTTYYVAIDKEDLRTKIFTEGYTPNRVITTNVTNFDNLFLNNTTFNSDILAWDTSNVTSMYQTFKGATAFNQNIGSWNTGNVTNMKAMFNGATAFNNGGSNTINNWNVGNVTNFELMFSGDWGFNQPIGNWNTGSALNMVSMFNGTYFNQNIGSWNVSNVTDMHGMFYHADRFNQNIGSWNTGNVTNMANMFDGAGMFNQNLYSWNIHSVTNHLSFDKDTLSTWLGNEKPQFPCNSNEERNTSYYCEAALYLDTNGVTIKAKPFARSGVEYTFNSQTYYVSANKNDIQTQIFVNSYDPSKIVTTKITDMSNLFKDRTTFNGNISSWDTSNVTNMNGLFLNDSSFNQDISKWNISNVTDISSMFSGTSSFNQNIGSWNISNVTDMHALFYGATVFNNGGSNTISTWNTANVTDMHDMFVNSDAFNQPIGTWNIANVTNISGMFYGADSFNQTLNTWNTGSVTDMNHTFYWAISFNQPLNNWNTANVTNMDGMFIKASVFDQNISSWNVDNVESHEDFDEFTLSSWVKAEKPSWPDDISSVIYRADYTKGSIPSDFSIIHNDGYAIDSNGIYITSSNYDKRFYTYHQFTPEQMQKTTKIVIDMDLYAIRGSWSNGKKIGSVTNDGESNTNSVVDVLVMTSDYWGGRRRTTSYANVGSTSMGETCADDSCSLQSGEYHLQGIWDLEEKKVYMNVTGVRTFSIIGNLTDSLIDVIKSRKRWGCYIERGYVHNGERMHNCRIELQTKG